MNYGNLPTDLSGELCSNAEHLEALRKVAQIAERHKAEMKNKLAETAELYAHGYRTQVQLEEMAECYVAVKRACQSAQERYHKAIYEHQTQTGQTEVR